MKKGFTLIELLIVITIIGILASIGLNSFTSAQKKGRDARRKTHLKQLTDALESYYNDQGQYPSDDGSGNLMGCGINAVELCTWGTTAFSNTTTGTVYMVETPNDGSTGQNYYYDAIADVTLNNKFLLYARLENTQDIDVPKNVDGDPQVYNGTSCGSSILCNYGISSSNITLPTPIDE